MGENAKLSKSSISFTYTIRIGISTLQFSISEADILNPDDYSCTGNTYMLYDEDDGHILCIVNADDEDQAFEIAADEDELINYEISDEECDTMSEDEYVNRGCTVLGMSEHRCRIYELGSVAIVELPRFDNLSYVATLEKYISQKNTRDDG